MSLRDEIGDLIRILTRGDPDGSGFVIGVDPCSDAIFDLVLSHATSGEAVERAWQAWIAASRRERTFADVVWRAALAAALSKDTHD